MRRTFTLLAATAALGVGITGSASAAILYTTSAHTTPVAVGATFYMKNTNLDYYINYQGAAAVIVCASNDMSLQVTQNSGGVFKANVTSGSLSACSQGWTFNAGGTLQISGSSITVGTNKAWLATTLTGTQKLNATTLMTANYASATGNPPVNGAWAQQPTAGGAPVTVKLDHAPSLSASGTSLTTSATYTIYSSLGGPTPSYSLG